MRSVAIASRFRGPPTTGNGGYSAGLVARELGGTVEVTLRKPPPLEQALEIRSTASGLTLQADEEIVAEARSAELELELPSPVTFERAQELCAGYVGFTRHEFPSCFVCGPERAPGDGLRIFPGAERGSDPVVAPFIPDASLADAGGVLHPEFVWAALDCPGYFGAAGPDYPKALLGRITAAIHAGVRVGEHCVVMGWLIGKEGRKLHAGTALFGPNGDVRARAKQTWIVVG